MACDTAMLAAQDFDRALARYRQADWTGREILLAERFDAAQAALAGWRARAEAGAALPPLAGTTLSVKACFDVAGWVTSCASRVRADDAPARENAAAVFRLVSAGAVLVGQTNMTEFAYGALGVNTAFGTPRSPLDPAGDRIAGGSSSGAAVSVALGLCDLALCSDTSGSARIPAAFCGVVGFKPSLGRYPAQGMVPLSDSFDVPGLIARGVGTCRLADTALHPAAPAVPAPPVIRLAVPQWLDPAALEPPVRDAFSAALRACRAAGITVTTTALDSLPESARIAATGGMIGAEALARHETTLESRFDLYDPLVGERLRQARDLPAWRYARALCELAQCWADLDRELAGFDGFLLPTVPMLPPRLAELAAPECYLALNRRAFSLTEFANRLDLPSISLPMAPGLPAGLMLTGPRGADDRTLAIAAVLEEALAAGTGSS